MLDSIRRAQQGTVLVVALIIVILVMVVVTDARHIALIEFEATRNADLDLKLEQACRGGYQIAECFLRDDLDNSEVDSLQEQWAAPTGIEWTFDPESAGSGSSWDSQDWGSRDADPNEESKHPQVRIYIEDEERKWPLNLLTLGNEANRKRRIQGLANVLDAFRERTSLDLDEGRATELAERIARFVQRKNDDGGYGPTPKPPTKTGSLLDVRELALDPGISPDLIFDQVDPDQAESGIVAPGLMQVLTLWTDLQVNINTASEAVLQGLFRSDANERQVATDIYAHREEQEIKLREEFEESRNEFRGPEEEEPQIGSVFQSVDDLEQAGTIRTMTSRIFNETRNLMTVTSKVFTIWVEAELEGSTLQRRWVVRREGARMVPILSERVIYPRFHDKEEEEAWEETDPYRD